MSATYNLANFRTLSQQSGRSNGSNGKKPGNQRLEPLKSQRAITPTEKIALPNASASTRNAKPEAQNNAQKEQKKTVVIDPKAETKQLGNGTTEYTQSIQYGNKTLHYSSNNPYGKSFLANSHIPADEEAEYFENVRSELSFICNYI